MHQLRVEGKSKQFTDEMNYLLEGFKSKQLKIRRSTAFEFSKKIMDEGFVVGIRPHSSIRRIFSLIHNDADPVYPF